MRTFFAIYFALAALNTLACGNSADGIVKYIEYISIEKNNTEGKQCKLVEVLFKANHTHSQYIETAFLELIMKNSTIGEVKIPLSEVIAGTNSITFCLNDELIQESKIRFLLQQNETIKITPNGYIQSGGTLCYTEVKVSIKDLVAKATLIE